MLRWVKLGLLAVVASTLWACSSNDKADSLKPAELVGFDATAKLKKLWRCHAGEGMDKRYTRFVAAVGDKAVYVVDAHGLVTSIDKVTGKRLWSQETYIKVSAGVGLHDDMLLLGSYDAEVIALSAQDGAELWRAEASSEILAPPASNGRVVVAQTIDGRVFGFDAKTGEQRWTFDHSTPVLTLRGTATPVVDSRHALIAFDNGQLFSLAADDGQLNWDVRLSSPRGRTELERVVDIDATPLVDGGYIYAVNYHGKVAAISKAQGRIIWSHDLSSFQDLTLAKNRLFVSAEDSAVVAFDASSGAMVWKNEQLFMRNIGAPAIIDDYLAVIDDDGYLHLLNQSDGHFAYRFSPSGDGFISAMRTFKGVNNRDVLLTLSDDGIVSAYQLKEKKQR